MSLLNKIMFWKKDEFNDDRLKPSLDNDLFNGQTPTSPENISPQQGLSPTSLDMPSQFDMPQVDESRPMQMSPDLGKGIGSISPQQNITTNNRENLDMNNKIDILSKDIEIISTKIDMLKASIEAINQKLNSMETKGEKYRW